TSRGWLTAERVALLPAGALVVNVARGDLAPSSVLLEGLRAGGLGGVALDVYASEAALAEALRRGERPEDPEALAALELMARPDVLCTPHNAFNTEEALARKAGQSVEQVVAWLERGAFVWEAPG
ncbi:MAG: hypothetical protein KC656_08425, partial [Myxococcales bacterium]|nr:hypothetical protein [Myxococcales bacterium]